MSSVCVDAPKGPSYYPQNITLQFYICYHKNYYGTWMLIEKLCYLYVSGKTKPNINFSDQDCNRPSAKCWVKDFVLPISIMPQIFIEDSGNLKNTCARKPKVPGSSRASGNVQRWALCNNRLGNVSVSVKRVEVVVRS